VSVPERGRWQDPSITLIRLTPIAAVIVVLTHLATAHSKQVLSLICYGGVLIGSCSYIILANRQPAGSERVQAFRKPARIMTLGVFLLSVFALVVLTLIRPNEPTSLWLDILMLILLVGAAFSIWRANREYSKAADAYPGKHATPSGPGTRRWPR